MIYVNSAMKQDYIIEILEKNTEDVTFKFIEKKGIKLCFETNTEDLDSAIVKAKAIIKGSEFGSALYFQVTK